MKAFLLKSKNVIDTESEIHYWFITSLANQVYPHYHDYFELFLVLNDKVLLRVDGSEILYEEGSLTVIRPDEVHSKELIGSGQHINLSFPKKTFNDLCSYLGKGFSKEMILRPKHPPSISLSKTEKNILISRFERLHTIPADNKDIIKMELRALLIELFMRYFKQYYHQEQDKIPMWVEIVLNEMQKKENFIKGIPKLIELSSKNHAYLCRVFKKYLNSTPIEFINDLKLNYAVNLLLHTDLNNLNISLESGFENLSHFYHVFKKKYGIAPNKYRKENNELFLMK